MKELWVGNVISLCREKMETVSKKHWWGKLNGKSEALEERVEKVE